jgi:antitoxin MazE
MRVRVQKRANWLALRLPKALAAEAHIAEGTEVGMRVVGGRLVVSPLLGELVGRITDGNRHGEVDLGRSEGREAW